MKNIKNQSDRDQTTDAFWQYARVLAYKSSFKRLSIMSLMLFCSNSVLSCKKREKRERKNKERKNNKETRPDTRHMMRLVHMGTFHF